MNHKVFLNIALEVASMSKSKRLKVGAILVKDKRILSTGYNGLPSGVEPDILEDENGVTKPDVIHAELNAILNAAKNGVSISDSILYVTHSPCEHCAALIKQCGISQVYYLNLYRNTNGILKLKEWEIPTYQYE